MRNLSKRVTGLAAFAFGIGAVAIAAPAETLEGRWSATVVQNGVAIPFRLDISGEGKSAVGTLYNGEDKETTTSANIQNGKVELDFDHYLTWITATVKNGELDGTIAISRRGNGNKPGEGEDAAKNGKALGSPFHALRVVCGVLRRRQRLRTYRRLTVSGRFRTNRPRVRRRGA